jgi:hypothetical protein
MTLPSGWILAEKEDDSIIVGSADESAAVAIMLADLDGKNLRQVARELSRLLEGTSPELDDDVYVFTFLDEDGYDAAAVVGEGDDDQFVVVYMFGDFDNPGVEEFLNSFE